MLKHLLHHVRLLSSIATAILLYFLLSSHLPWLTRFLISWNVWVLLYIVLIYTLMANMDAKQISKKYEPEDQAAPVILVISIIGAIVAMASIVAILSGLEGVSTPEKNLHIVLAALTVIDTWVLIPTMFTLHYADM